MPRREFTKATAGRPTTVHGVSHVTCAHCRTGFIRPYRMNQTRAAKPQYCSPACRDGAFRVRAEADRADRFWRSVDRRGADECWPFLLFRDEKGYGRFQWAPGQPRIASRVALHLATGEDPGEWHVLHRCDNPPCCNPNHLFLGMPRDNVADMDAKGRRRSAPRLGSACNTSKLTEAQAMEAFRSTEPAHVVAARFGVTATAISLIRSGRNWAHATGQRPERDQKAFAAAPVEAAASSGLAVARDPGQRP